MNRTFSERAIVLAPRGRDAEVAASILREAGIGSEAVAGLEPLANRLLTGAGFIIVTEEALRTADLKPIAEVIEKQAEWSDLPFILLTDRGGSIERNPAAGRYLELLGNVTFLERPFHPTTLVSVAQAALRARRRQYDARKRLEDIRAIEERLRLAIQAADVGFWDVDLINDVLIWPPVVKRMFGISPELPVSMADFYNGVHDDDREATTAAFAAAADPARRALYDVEYRTVGKEDGLVRWVAAKGRGQFDGDGRCVRVIGTAIDVTARKHAEAELRELNEHLEQRVAAVIAEREQAEEALRQAQKMEAVGQLTGGIAHDFNNMLAVVIGSLDLLKRHSDAADARTQRYIDAAADGAQRAATLTQRLLAFSRQQRLKPEVIDANKLVAGMSDFLSHSLGGAIRLDTVLVDGAWRTHADRNQLENAILNLAVNARDAMPDGGRLTIETGNAHVDGGAASASLGVPAGQYLLIAVTDTGSGMPQDVIAKAFDPFFTTKEVGKGTGLGLSQVYGFVRQSGGHIKIHSEPGQGTTISIYLPRCFGESAVDEGMAALPLLRGDEQEVILLVEDERAVRQFAVDALGELGYRVLEADGAASALRLLDIHADIALLFTDIVMPDVNGRRLAEEALRRRPGLKVLFTSGYTRNSAAHNGVDPDVELIGKPYTLEQLAAKIRAILDN